MSRKENEGVGGHKEKAEAAGEERKGEEWYLTVPRSPSCSPAGCRHRCQSRCKVTLRLTDGGLPGIFGRSAVDRISQDKRQWGAELFTWHHWPSLTSLIKHEAGYLTSWRWSTIVGSQGEGSDWTQREVSLPWQPLGSSRLVLTLHSKCFPWYSYTIPCYSASNTKELASQCPQGPFWQHSCHNTQLCTAIIQNPKMKCYCLHCLKWCSQPKRK